MLTDDSTNPRMMYYDLREAGASDVAGRWGQWINGGLNTSRLESSQGVIFVIHYY